MHPDGEDRCEEAVADRIAVGTRPGWQAIDSWARRQLHRWFTYHPPVLPDQVDRHEAVRAAGQAFAEMIMRAAPDTGDRSEALKSVREAVMWANAAIALVD